MFNFKILIIMKKGFLFTMLCFSFVFIGCQEDNNLALNELTEKKGDKVYFEAESHNSIIKVRDTTSLRIIYDETYNHKIVLNYEVLEEDLEKSSIKFVNPNNINEYVKFSYLDVNNIANNKFSIRADASNGVSKDYVITIYDDNYFKTESKGGRGRLLKYIKELAEEIIEELADDDGGSSNNSCAQEAVATCGAGNVQSVSYESGWFSSSCSFTCC